MTELQAILGELSKPGRPSDMHRRIELLRQALAFFTRDQTPPLWAALQVELGNSLGQDPLGERADNLERAIEHFKEALTVRTRERFPRQWARTQSNLGLAWVDRIRGERADNLERAIEHFKEALTVREAFPEEWARTQHNLGNAYVDRIRGERANNLERASHHFKEALTVYTREAFPRNYRTTQGNVGQIYFEREDWVPAHFAYAASIKAGADLLAEAFTEAGRRSEVGESARLYRDDSYTLLRLDRPGDSLVRLEQGKTQLLNEALALAAVDLTMLAEADQEAMRSGRQAVRELEAEMRLPADTPARRSDRGIAEALRQARDDLDRRIVSIRAERPEFMPTGLDLPGLLDLIPEGGALVAPLFTSKGSAVFVLPHGTATVTKEHVIELERFTTGDLLALLMGSADTSELGGWLGAYYNYRSSPTAWFRKQWLRPSKPRDRSWGKFSLASCTSG